MLQDGSPPHFVSLQTCAVLAPPAFFFFLASRQHNVIQTKHSQPLIRLLCSFTIHSTIPPSQLLLTVSVYCASKPCRRCLFVRYPENSSPALPGADRGRAQLIEQPQGVLRVSTPPKMTAAAGTFLRSFAWASLVLGCSSVRISGGVLHGEGHVQHVNIIARTPIVQRCCRQPNTDGIYTVYS